MAQSGHMTFLSYTDWSNFSVASIDVEKTFIGLGAELDHQSPAFST